MEQDFGERLKRYRREKNLTQQDLADKLSVSNKTVSRWESGGGYPDVPLLVPLARALGVDVDDLLDGEKPVRTLSRTDWQNLLSFGFAMGGGILFYLLKLFVPVAVCYLAFLGCLAYGTYLQRYYCYHSKWFLWGCAVMDFCINLSLILALLALPLVMNWAYILFTCGGLLLILGIGTVLLLTAVLTALTLCLVSRFGLGRGARFRLRLKKPPLSALLPALGPLLLAGVYIFYLNDNLRVDVIMKQNYIYYGLLAGFALVCGILSLKKGRRAGLLPTAAMVLCGFCLPSLTARFAWLPNSMTYVEVTDSLASMYFRFGRASLPMALGAVIFVLLILSLAFLRLERVGPVP